MREGDRAAAGARSRSARTMVMLLAGRSIAVTEAPAGMSTVPCDKVTPGPVGARSMPACATQPTTAGSGGSSAQAWSGCDRFSGPSGNWWWMKYPVP